MGFNPYTFSYKHQGLEERLIGPEDGRVRAELLA